MIELIAAAAAALTMQSVDDYEAACKAYQAEHGGTADCRCLAEKVAADEALQAEIAKLVTPEDVAGASDEMKQAVADCTDA